MSTKELQAVAAAYAEARGRGEGAALATVVKTSGSTYRRPGARMLVTSGGKTAGSISGGCLEDDARERALAVLAGGRPELVCYDTTAESDILWGSGVGCTGVIHVLIEPLGGAAPALEAPACIAQCFAERRPGALATLIRADNGAAPGNLLWLPDMAGQPIGAAGDTTLAAAVREDAARALRERSPRLRTYPLDGGGRAEVFIDVIEPPAPLFIFGAGHDAIPLARLAKEIGREVHVIDGRSAYATRERFPDADEVLVCPAKAVGGRVSIQPGDAAVIMTHNYLNDLAILRVLLASPAGYIGLLGPRRRAERLLAEIAAADGRPLPPGSLRRLHGPAGLDIGAEAPEQIALSILAEIEAVAARRRGGPLRKRRAPLHSEGSTRPGRARSAGVFQMAAPA